MAGDPWSEDARRALASELGLPEDPPPPVDVLLAALPRSK